MNSYLSRMTLGLLLLLVSATATALTLTCPKPSEFTQKPGRAYGWSWALNSNPNFNFVVNSNWIHPSQTTFQPDAALEMTTHYKYKKLAHYFKCTYTFSNKEWVKAWSVRVLVNADEQRLIEQNWSYSEKYVVVDDEDGDGYLIRYRTCQTTAATPEKCSVEVN